LAGGWGIGGGWPWEWGGGAKLGDQGLMEGVRGWWVGDREWVNQGVDERGRRGDREEGCAA